MHRQKINYQSVWIFLLSLLLVVFSSCDAVEETVSDSDIIPVETEADQEETHSSAETSPTEHTTTPPITYEPSTTAPTTTSAPVTTNVPITTSSVTKAAETTGIATHDYVLNTNSKKFHEPTCSSVSKMSDKNKDFFNGTRSDIIAKGYDPCHVCNP